MKKSIKIGICMVFAMSILTGCMNEENTQTTEQNTEIQQDKQDMENPKEDMQDEPKRPTDAGGTPPIEDGSKRNGDSEKNPKEGMKGE